MRRQELALLVSAALVSALPNTPALAVSATQYSPQNLLIGATPTVQAAANNGKGVVFGIIDSGGTAAWIGFQGWGGSTAQGRITASICEITCTNASTGNIDDNGHGTFVTSEIIGGIPSIGLVGVAPAANAIEVKVLNAAGSGNTTSLSAGIRDAVDRGARILNLSIGPTGTASSQLAFWKYIANAVNYAASKNAVLVFAAGNNAQVLSAGANITGFSDAALARMIIVGSTNAKKQLSSFSNKPGTAHFISTSGKSVFYESMWVVADGENIYGASNVKTSAGYNSLAIYTGTSMAAPQAAGAAGLLASKWPFLLSQGTIPHILEATAQDLGAAGMDTVYGKGFLRVDLAMQPVGGQSVPVASGSSVQVASSGGGAVASGAAFGNMPGIAQSLSKAVSYDSFMRGFPLFNSAAVIASASMLPESPATSLAMGETGAGARRITMLDDQDWLAFSGTPMPADTRFVGDRQQLGFTLDPARAAANEWSYGLMRGRTYFGAGQGSQAPLSFGDARWGGDSAFFDTDAGAASALIGTLPHAQFATLGFAVNERSRIAASVVSQAAEAYGDVRGVDSSAFGGAIAYTMQPTKNWMVSMTTSFLSESNLLLGSRAYSHVLGVGPSPLSTAFGAGTNIDLGHGYQIGFDATYATTGAAENPLSLIGKTSRIESDSFSFAFSKSNLTGANDTLHVTVSQPLRVIAGTATLTIPVGTDDNAQPIIETERVTLAPSGHEIDYGIGYVRPLLPCLKASLNVLARQDADNISGAQDTAAVARLRLTF